MGVGVACGPVWAGQVGAASRLEYTVIGDPVNEAAVHAAGGDERAHWAPDREVELRGRGEPTRTWVRRTD